MRSQIPLLLVLAVATLGLIRIVQYNWREGTTLIGMALVTAGVLRALLPDGRIGLVAIRGRGMDVLLYGGLGLAVMAVSLTIQGGPLHR